jgi:spore germination protein KC
VPIRSKTKVSAKIINGHPVFNVTIKEESWISEINTAINIDDPRVINQIQKKMEKTIKKQIIASIKEAQSLKCDVFGFGEKLHIANPKYWKKVQNNWDEHFANAKVIVEVKSYNRRSGVRRNPFWDALKQ